MYKKIIFIRDSFLKKSTAQSLLLNDSDKIFIEKGDSIEIESVEESDRKHLKVQLTKPLNDEIQWFIFNEHALIQEVDPINKPLDKPPPGLIKINKTKRSGAITLPGFQSTFYLSDPIVVNGNFSWAEATKNGQRIPVNKDVVENIIKIAHVMEEVRRYLGNKPITVNSWYRDPVTNRLVGGATRSRHLSGDAVDFVVQGITPPEVNRKLESWWGNRGGLASASVFTHIDTRGYRARWSYGF